MRKIKKMDSIKIKKIVKEHFLDDDFLLPEDKIDSIIKEYLSKRIVNDDESPSVDRKINPKSREIIESIILNLNVIVDDLELIKEIESDVLINESKYVDELMGNKLEELSRVIRGLENIIESTKNSD